MNTESVRNEMDQINQTLIQINQNIELLSRALQNVSNTVHNFIVICQNNPEEVAIEEINCPKFFSECPNNPELCVFDYASEEDKDDICNEPRFANNLANNQVINSLGPYPYSRMVGRFRINNTPEMNPDPIVLGVKKDYIGSDRNSLIK